MTGRYRTNKMFKAILFVCITVVLTAAAFSQQQQNANAYAYWDFGRNSNDIENVDQRVWIAKPANGTQWVMLWFWTADPQHGGYLGFNTSDLGDSQALFSLWNADKAEGENCDEFGGEGVGWSCRKPMNLRSDVAYRLRLARTKTDNEGVWWAAWIYQEASTGKGTEFYLGAIRVKKGMNMITGNSIGNFSEYFGHTVEKCSSVPVSILVVAPPSANRDAKTDTYARMSRRNGGTEPELNPCRTGNEPQGNMLKVEDFDLKGTAASAIFIGGTQKDHVMPKGITVPGLPAAPATVVKSAGDTKPVAPAPHMPKPDDPTPPQQAVTAAFSKSPHSVAELTISERSVKNVLILKLEGKLTKAGGTMALYNAIRESVAHGKKNILVDLKGVTYVENGALSVLIDGNPANEGVGGKVKMLDPSEAFQTEPMIMKFLEVFSTYDNEDEALASFL